MRNLRVLIRRFLRLRPARRALAIEAAAYLLAARLALLVLPFPRLAKRLGVFVPPTDARVAEVRAQAGQDHARLAAEVGWAVTRSARYAPLRIVCLPQAMAAQAMLRRRGVASIMHFGAAQGRNKPLDAHAWLDAAGVEVTGYPVAAEFTEIGCFV